MSNSKTVAVVIKRVYGAPLIYPACENAARFAALTRKKTLSGSDIVLISALGFTVVEKPEFTLTELAP
ncbi:MAG: hypothetical protein KA784_00235 [Aquabacterium sp.]|nr:hypothetical protein [Aquabacterium sp.]